MQEKLVIYLHPDQLDRPGWAVVAADGTVRQHAYQDQPESLATLAADKEVIVIVPSVDVLLTNAMLPKLARTRLLQALPYAIEEQLIDEIDNLHFAAGEQRADGYLPVAVITHAKMQTYLSLLTTWQLQPTVILPAVFTLDAKENQWQVVIADMVLVRMTVNQGFGCDIQNIESLLKLAVSASEVPPSSIHVANYSDQALPMSEWPVPVKETRLPVQDFMVDLAAGAVKSAPVNLLQGRYAIKKSAFPHMDKLWKAASYLVIAWVLLLFFYPLGSYFILKQKLSSLDQQITQIYKRNFPQSASIIAPKLRLDEKLQKLRAQQGENRLLVLLGYVGEGMSASSMIKLKQLDFQNGQLTLTLTATNSDDFSAFTDALTQQGLQVRQQNATLDGERVNAVLQVE